MFAKDSRTENFLTSMGVEWSYTNAIFMAELVADWARDNLARPEPKREDAILEYAALWEAGSIPPAPILAAKGPKGYPVLDGVQRLCSAEYLGYTKVSAYVVSSDSPQTLMTIRVLANARLQGRPEPYEWTRRRAVDILVIGQGLSAAEVAKMGGWRVADVEKLVRVLDWGFHIRSINGPDNLSDSMIEVLARHTDQEELAKSPKAIAEFLTAIKQAKFSAEDADPYIEDFFEQIPKTSKAHDIYMGRLEDFRSEPEVLTRILGRKGVQMRPDMKLRRHLKAALTVMDELAKAERVSYIDEYFRLLEKLKNKLHEIAKKHQKPTKARVPGDQWGK